MFLCSLCVGRCAFAVVGCMSLVGVCGCYVGFVVCCLLLVCVVAAVRLCVECFGLFVVW